MHNEVVGRKNKDFELINATKEENKQYLWGNEGKCF